MKYPMIFSSHSTLHPKHSTHKRYIKRWWHMINHGGLACLTMTTSKNKWSSKCNRRLKGVIMLIGLLWVRACNGCMITRKLVIIILLRISLTYMACAQASLSKRNKNSTGNSPMPQFNPINSGLWQNLHQKGILSILRPQAKNPSPSPTKMTIKRWKA